MEAKLKLDGFKGLDYALGNLNKESQARVFRPAINSALVVIRRILKAAAPRGSGATISGSGSSKYGHLFKNITVIRAKIRNKVEVSGAVTTGNAFWGRMLEKGTKYIPSTPWFDPAFNSSQNQIMDAIKKRVTMELPKEFERLVKKGQ